MVGLPEERERGVRREKPREFAVGASRRGSWNPCIIAKPAVDSPEEREGDGRREKPREFAVGAL